MHGKAQNQILLGELRAQLLEIEFERYKEEDIPPTASNGDKEGALIIPSFMGAE